MDDDEFNELAREILGDGVDIDEMIKSGSADVDLIASRARAGMAGKKKPTASGKASGKAPPASTKDPHGRFLRPKEVAARLNLPIRTVYKMLADGRVTGFQIAGKGSSTLITEQSIDDYVRASIERFQIANGIRPAD